MVRDMMWAWFDVSRATVAAGARVDQRKAKKRNMATQNGGHELEAQALKFWWKPGLSDAGEAFSYKTTRPPMPSVTSSPHTEYKYANAPRPRSSWLFRSSIEQEMAIRQGQGVETRGGWKTTLLHIMAGPPAASDGGDAGVKGSKGAPHVPLKVSVTAWGRVKVQTSTLGKKGAGGY